LQLDERPKLARAFVAGAERLSRDTREIEDWDNTLRDIDLREHAIDHAS